MHPMILLGRHTLDHPALSPRPLIEAHEEVSTPVPPNRRGACRRRLVNDVLVVADPVERELIMVRAILRRLAD